MHLVSTWGIRLVFHLNGELGSSLLNGELGSSHLNEELGSSPFWASKCKIRSKTLPPLESPLSLFLNGAKVLILIQHFYPKMGENLIPHLNGGEANSPI